MHNIILTMGQKWLLIIRREWDVNGKALPERAAAL